MKSMHINKIKKCEDVFVDLFSTHFSFSKNLVKYVDPKIFDMYDHNYFKHNRYTTNKEIEEAYKYQYDNYFDYLKFISNEKMNKNVVSKNKLEESITITMLYDGEADNFSINNKIVIKDISLNELNKIELKHYGKIYGEDFVLARNKEFISLRDNNPNFKYYGAYLSDKIVGACHSFTCNKYTCVDSLIVDNKHRHKYIATTMLKHIIDQNEYVYLHADQDDTPKNIYKKLGFKTIDKTYEYFKKVNL